MHKFIQVNLPVGTSTWEYQIKAGQTLSLLLVGVTSFDAQVRVNLTGKGARVNITGVLIGRGDTKQYLHTMQIHKAPETTSDLLIKTVLSGYSKCLYDGGIRVEKDAQQTNAYQKNENLLLSGRSYAESKPSLEILANDVRCTHGSTTGPIDKEQLWYLQTRGIQNGAKLITEGFIMSALMRLGDESIISKLCKKIFPNLPGE